MHAFKLFAQRIVTAGILAAAVIASLPTVAAAQGETPEIDRMIATIRNDPGNAERSWEAIKLAQRVAQLVDEGQGASIGNGTITALIDLLKDGNEDGNFWIVAALSKIGPRAKRAVPVLLELHPKACTELRALPFSSGVHYVDGIEWALLSLTDSAPDCRNVRVRRLQ